MRPLIISFLIAYATYAQAGQPTDKMPDYAPVIGTGQFSCGQFLEYRKANNPQQLDLVVQWVWGFLSAYNVRGNFSAEWRRVSHIENLPDSPTVLLSIETYCRQSPVGTVMDSTFALIKELHGTVVSKIR